MKILIPNIILNILSLEKLCSNHIKQHTNFVHWQMSKFSDTLHIDFFSQRNLLNMTLTSDTCYKYISRTNILIGSQRSLFFFQKKKKDMIFVFKRWHIFNNHCVFLLLFSIKILNFMKPFPPELIFFKPDLYHDFNTGLI